MFSTPTIPLSILTTQKSVTKQILCHNSGVMLGTLEVLIIEGQIAYLESHSEAVYTHPFYRLTPSVLQNKLSDCLTRAHESEWSLSDSEKLRLRLLTSAVLHSLGAIKQHGYSLPSLPVAIGSAGRLLALAKWYFITSSQRVVFPTYSVSPGNQNMEWETLKHWLDVAYEVRDEWGKKVRLLEQEEQKRLYDENVRDIKSESFRRIDLRKVWQWIQNQLEGRIASGRIETMKSLFMSGDVEAHEWLADDVDDLQEMLCLHCDLGNEIMFFINQRLNGIRALIRDFYSSFTLLGGRGTEDGIGLHDQDGQTKEEEAFLKEYDDKVEALEELPQKPRRESFATFGLFLKSEAQWNILRRRWEAGPKARGSANESRPSTDLSPNLNSNHPSK